MTRGLPNYCVAVSCGYRSKHRWAMSVRLRETVKKIRRNLSLRSPRADSGGILNHTAISGSSRSSWVKDDEAEDIQAVAGRSQKPGMQSPVGMPATDAAAGLPAVSNYSSRPESDYSTRTRTVQLTRSEATGGFGFVTGSERPMVVRFVDQDGPSSELLLPGDYLLAVNGVDVTNVPQATALELIRCSGDAISLTVRQPSQTNGTRSILRSCSSDGKKLKKSSSRVRFSESVEEVDKDGASAISYNAVNRWHVESSHVLKIYLENHQTRTIQYADDTTAQDVLNLLLQRLEIKATEYFGLVIQEPGYADAKDFQVLPHAQVIAEMEKFHQARCSIRVIFGPKDPYDLLSKDTFAFDYLYKQCCNDLTEERLLADSQGNVALRLTSLHILEHSLVQGMSPNKVTVKKVDKAFGLRTFVSSALAASMPPKVLHRKLDHFLKLGRGLAAPGQKRVTALQARLHYMQIAAGLSTFCARRFTAYIPEGQQVVTITLLVGPNCGISRLLNLQSLELRRLVNLYEVEDLAIPSQAGYADEAATVRRVEITTTSAVEPLLFHLDSHVAEDFCSYVRRYKELLTGVVVVANGDCTRTGHKTNGFDKSYRSPSDVLHPGRDDEEVAVPPADYDQVSSDSEEDDGNLLTVNSMLSAAFDDLDDGLLDEEFKAVRAVTSAEEEEMEEEDFSVDALLPRQQDLGNEQALRSPQANGRRSIPEANLAPAVTADNFELSTAAACSGNLVQRPFYASSRRSTSHDKEIGMQLSAIDAVLSQDPCGRGEDESGIDSDSEDSGNETLNSVDTTSSYAALEPQSMMNGHWAPDRRGLLDSKDTANREASPPISHNGVELPGYHEPARDWISLATGVIASGGNHKHHPCESMDPVAEDVSGSAGSIVQTVSKLVAKPLMIRAGDGADDVSTEEDDEDCDDNSHSAGVTRANAALSLPAVAGSLAGNSEDMKVHCGDIFSAVYRRHLFQGGAVIGKRDVEFQQAVGCSAAPPVKNRPVSDGVTLGILPYPRARFSSGSQADETAGPQSGPSQIPNTIASSPDPVVSKIPGTVRAGRSKAQGARRATVASSSRLAQAFARLSASSSTGSHDFCPATPPRNRSISSPFNVSSTAQSVLARSVPVRKPLTGIRESRAPLNATSSTGLLPLARPSCPPPPPPSQVRDAADADAACPRGITDWGGDSCRSRFEFDARTPQHGTAAPIALPYRNSATACGLNPVREGQLPSHSADNLAQASAGGYSSQQEHRGWRGMIRSASNSIITSDQLSSKHNNREERESSVRLPSAAELVLPQPKTGVFARLLEAFRPRKKAASLSRAASASELLQHVDSKKLSLPRSISGVYRQRPSIFSGAAQEVTLLRATSFAAFNDNVDVGSPTSDRPQTSNFCQVPAAEVCAIDTAAVSPRLQWSKTYDLETFRAPLSGRDVTGDNAGCAEKLSTSEGPASSPAALRAEAHLREDVRSSEEAPSGNQPELAAVGFPAQSDPVTIVEPEGSGDYSDRSSANDGNEHAAVSQQPRTESFETLVPTIAEVSAPEATVCYAADDGLAASSRTSRVLRLDADAVPQSDEAKVEAKLADIVGLARAEAPPIGQPPQRPADPSLDGVRTQADDETSAKPVRDDGEASSGAAALAASIAAIADFDDVIAVRLAVDRLLGLLSRLSEASETGYEQNASPTAADLVALNASLSSEAQLMVQECKQMVASIARRQRFEAGTARDAAARAHTEGEGFETARTLREQEKDRVRASCRTFSRLLKSLAIYAAADHGRIIESRGPRLWKCTARLGEAYLAALSAASADASASDAPEDRASVAGLESGGRASQPLFDSADVAVRRLMAVATDLATALGALIRLLKEFRGISLPNLPTA